MTFNHDTIHVIFFIFKKKSLYMGKKQYLFHQIKIRCKIHVHKGVIITNETD